MTRLKALADRLQTISPPWGDILSDPNITTEFGSGFKWDRIINFHDGMHLSLRSAQMCIIGIAHGKKGYYHCKKCDDLGNAMEAAIIHNNGRYTGMVILGEIFCDRLHAFIQHWESKHDSI